MSILGEIPIETSWYVPRDVVYNFEPARFAMHPLLHLVLLVPDPLERLPKAIDMLLQRALGRLDAEIARLS